MVRGILTIALATQLFGGPALAGASPNQATQRSAVYSEPALRCAFQRLLAFHPLNEQRVRRSLPEVPRLDFCGIVTSQVR